MNALDETLGYLYFTARSMQWVRHQLGYLPPAYCDASSQILDRIAQDLAGLQQFIVQHRYEPEEG